jgi:hypothetical protein
MLHVLPLHKLLPILWLSRLQTASMGFLSHTVHPILLSFCMMVMMSILLHTLCFHVFPPLPVPLLAPTCPAGYWPPWLMPFWPTRVWLNYVLLLLPACFLVDLRSLITNKPDKPNTISRPRKHGTLRWFCKCCTASLLRKCPCPTFCLQTFSTANNSTQPDTAEHNCNRL